MRTSGPGTARISARGVAAGIAMVSVAALGACASSVADQPSPAQGVASDGQAAVAMQGIRQPPREFLERLQADNSAKAALALQGIVHPPGAFLEQLRADSNAAARLAAQGIRQPPRAYLEQLMADNNAAARLALQGIRQPSPGL